MGEGSCGRSGLCRNRGRPKFGGLAPTATFLSPSGPSLRVRAGESLRGTILLRGIRGGFGFARFGGADFEVGLDGGKAFAEGF